MKFVLRWLVWSLLVFAANRSVAQISSTGKLFYIAFMEMELSPFGPNQQYPDSLLFYITSEVNTTVTIDNPRRSGSTQTINITAGKVNRYSADPDYYYTEGYEQASTSDMSKTCLRITAKDPVNVYLLNIEDYRSDGTFVLPYEAIPPAPEYRICSYTPTKLAGGKYKPSEFIIVAMDANVEVEIEPTTKLASGKTTKHSVILAKGQVYQVQSDPLDGNTGGNNVKGDLTGTRVRVINGCGKINVFSGMVSALVPGVATGCGTSVDHLYTQVFPTKILGTKHVLMPFSGQTRGYVYRVVASKPNTKVWVNGTLATTLTNAGQYYHSDVTSAAAICITTDSQAYVVQYMRNGSCSGLSGQQGDPAILIMPDYNQKMLKTVVGTATTNNMNKHWVNILVNSSATKAVKVNGNYISSTVFTNVACAGQAYATVAVANPSTNVIECDSGLIVVAYGLGQYESYSYCSGALFENMDYEIKITRKGKCPGENVKLEAITTNTKVKGYAWNFGDGYHDTGKVVNHRIQKVGSFYVVLKTYITGPCGSLDSVIRSKIIDILPGPVFNIPDTVFQCKDTLNYTFTGPVKTSFFYKWQDSSASNVYVARNPGKVWFMISDTFSKCVLYDSSWVKQFKPLKPQVGLDTANKCLPTNFYSLSDKTTYNGDSYQSARWKITRTYIASVSKRDTFSTLDRFRISFDTTGIFPVKYWVTSKNGCFDSITTTIGVYHMPIAKYNASNSEFCQKALASFTDSSSGDGGIVNSYWNFGDGGTATGPKVTHSYNNFDTFTVRLITETLHGCRDTVDSAVVIHPLPKLIADIATNNVCVKANRFTFQDNSTIPYGTLSNLWKYEKTSVANQLTVNNVKFSDTGTFKITLYNTSNKGCKDSISKFVYVAPEPKARLALLDSMKCFDVHYFDLDDVSTISKGSLATRLWSFSDATSATTKTVSKKKFSTYGNYTVKLVVSSATYGCKDSVSRNLQVYAAPLAPFSINDSTQCLPNNKFDFTPVTAFSVSGVTPTHDWDLGDGDKDIVSNPSHAYTNTGNFKVTYIITTDQGCADTASRMVEVMESPKALFSTSKDSSCLGSYKYDFVNQTVFGNGFTSKWTLGDASTATTTDVMQKTYTAPNTFNVKLVVTSNKGCKDSTLRTVHVLPVPQAAFTVNNKTQCFAGNSFQFSNTTATNGASPMQYQWVFTPGSTYTTQNIAPQSMTDTGSFLVELTASSAFGCSTKITDQIYVAETPTVSITGGQGCVGWPIQFNGTAAVNSGTITTYSWDFGDGKTASTEDPVHTYTNANSYNVRLTVTSDKGCSNTAGPIQAVAFPIPNADFAAEQIESRGMETDHKLTFTGNGASQYFWTFHDGQTNSSGGPVVVTFTEQGIRPVQLLVISADGCRDSVTKNIILNPELQMWLVTTFTPNEDGLNEVFGPSTTFGLSNYRLQIFDRWGGKMFESTDPANRWNGSDGGGDPAPEGVYAYHIVFRYVDGKLFVYRGTVTLMR
jgi:gliding motility-associated-like protein